MTEDQHQAVRDKYHIIVEGDSLPPPGVAFTDFKLPRPVCTQLASKGIQRPTPIQMQVCSALGQALPGTRAGEPCWPRGPAMCAC